MVTVLMTVYNEKNDILKQSIDSILQQTYKNIKIMIIVDNPDNAEAISLISDYCKEDKRLIYLVNDKNYGLPYSLNKGLDLIDTPYIARMDADDIAKPDRILKQLNYMEKNSDIALIGTNIIYFDSDEKYKRSPLPKTYKEIKKLIRFQNVMCHPTFFAKTEVLKKFKYRNLKYSQDYDLVCRLIENNYKIENLGDYELEYRISKKSNNKMIYQTIVQQTIQYYFKKGKLSSVNIYDKVEEKIKNLKEIDEQNYIEAHKIYDTACSYLRKGKKTGFIKNFILAFLKSDIERKYIVNILIYKILYRGGVL